MVDVQDAEKNQLVRDLEALSVEDVKRLGRYLESQEIIECDGNGLFEFDPYDVQPHVIRFIQHVLRTGVYLSDVDTPAANQVREAAHAFHKVAQKGGFDPQGHDFGQDDESDAKQRIPCLMPGCCKTLSNLYALKRHMKNVHEGLRDFQCDVCSKGFSSRDSLNRHMTSHSTIRDFPCTLCEKAFKTKDGLNAHHQTIHGKISGGKRQRTATPDDPVANPVANPVAYPVAYPVADPVANPVICLLADTLTYHGLDPEPVRKRLSTAGASQHNDALQLAGQPAGKEQPPAGEGKEMNDLRNSIRQCADRLKARLVRLPIQDVDELNIMQLRVLHQQALDIEKKVRL